MGVRAVIDTNVWISALLNPSGFPARLRKHFENGAFRAVVSEPLVEELVEVLGRPRIKDKYGIAEDDIEELLILIEERMDHVLLAGNISVCRDVDDNVAIETAIIGKADYLVTRDDDMKFDKEVMNSSPRQGWQPSPSQNFLRWLKEHSGLTH